MDSRDMCATEELLRQRHRVTVAEYHRRAELRLLAQDARVERLEGVVLERPRRGGRLSLLNRLLDRVVGDRAIV
jgi:hypothetical protein